MMKVEVGSDVGPSAKGWGLPLEVGKGMET